MRRTLPPIALPLALAACAQPQPRAGFEAALPPPPPAAPRLATGGIFNPDTGYAALAEGNRARAVGDPIVIVLVEATSTAKSTEAQTERSGSIALIPPSAGPLGFLDPAALNASGQGSFNGEGNAAQTNSLRGSVAVTIAEVRPNGTALVRGERRMLLSQGEEWIQFSGIVRLADLSADNQIVSTRVADARIEYTGNGSVQQASREGWLSRFFNAISPF